MNRPAIWVLALTFIALVAATLWVPVESVAGVEPRWTWLWRVPEPGIDVSGESVSVSDRYITLRFWDEPGGPAGTWVPAQLRWTWLIGQLALVAAFGGLLTLILRTRAARSPATA